MSQNPPQFSLKQLLGGVTAVAVACIVLVKVVQVEPLRGPLLFVADPAAENKAFGLVATPVLALGMLSLVVKPNVATWFLCCVSVLLWLVLGVLGATINC